MYTSSRIHNQELNSLERTTQIYSETMNAYFMVREKNLSKTIKLCDLTIKLLRDGSGEMDMLYKFVYQCLVRR